MRAMGNYADRTSWLAGLLTGWGIRESWAKIIAGAVIGAAVAAGLLSGCTATYSQAADGAVEWHGAVVLPVQEGK